MFVCFHLPSITISTSNSPSWCHQLLWLGEYTYSQIDDAEAVRDRKLLRKQCELHLIDFFRTFPSDWIERKILNLSLLRWSLAQLSIKTSCFRLPLVYEKLIVSLWSLIDDELLFTCFT